MYLLGNKKRDSGEAVPEELDNGPREPPASIHVRGLGERFLKAFAQWSVFGQERKIFLEVVINFFQSLE